MAREIKHEIRNANDLLRRQVVSMDDSVAQNFTPEVHQMEGAIDAIDIYDTFDELKIKPELYSAPDDASKYGIHYVPAIHKAPDKPRIMPWQQNAAADFLKTKRGFGLLADVVGSGKTYEAGVVLSELVYRGEVGSVLIVVPSELVGNWKKVMELDFGLGEGVLHQVTRIDEIDAVRPTIATISDVREWVQSDGGENLSNSIAYDLIIVDEAHQLCERENNCIISFLSKIITKSNQDGHKNVYCLLLSATPHDGDLASMFDLWYFIHTRGMDPHAMNAEEYVAAKNKYIKEEWLGGKNVSEFIRKCKISLFDITERGVSIDEFRQKLLADYTGSRPYDDLNEWQKLREIEACLTRNDDLRSRVDDQITSFYKAALNKIMVRQGDAKSTLMRKKKTVNAFFLPVEEGVPCQTTINYDGERSTLLFDGLYFPNDYFPTVRLDDGELKPLDQYLAGLGHRASWKDYANLVPHIIKGLPVKSDCALMYGFERYFSKMFATSGNIEGNTAAKNSGTYNLLLPYMGDCTHNKMRALVDILQKHPNERAIIFFDYAQESNQAANYEGGRRRDSLYDRVEQMLAATDLGGRMIAGLVDAVDIDAIEANKQALATFNDDANPNCILLVKTDGYTKGANLQKASLIVNFQVSCDPIDMEQKIGRIFRLGQTRDVTVYSLVDICRLEGYALAYFTGIGLFDVNNADATILAGSNLTEMVSVRCPHCGDSAIIPKEDYSAMLDELSVPYEDALDVAEGNTRYVGRVNAEFTKAYLTDAKGHDLGEYDLVGHSDLCDRIRDSELLCNDNHQGWFYVRGQVAGNVYKCSADAHHVFRRSANATQGYQCMNRAVSAPMNVTGHNQFGCDKLCTVKHCSYHMRNFANCPLHTMDVYSVSRLIADAGSYALAIDKLCGACVDKDRCKNDRTHRCCPIGATENDCLHCRERKNSTCAVGPHCLQFDDNWERADCPYPDCGGKLQVQKMSRFSEHINYLWDVREGQQNKSFCELLLREAENVREMKDILDRSTD